jgi:hypothetical protein
MTEDTAISVRFHKPLKDWTADDRKVIVQRLRDYMRDPSTFNPKTGRPWPRKRKRAKK